jgi:predicted DNA-binding protein (UPF0251 family)
MSSATEVSAEALEHTRMIAAQIQSVILQRLAEVTQTRAAEIMGVHASTVSRMHNDISDVAKLLAAIGLKVAPADSIVTDQEELRFFKRMTVKYLDADLQDHSFKPLNRRSTDRS